MATARGFAKRVTKWGDGISLGIAKATGEFGVRYYRALIDATPVDTGFARSRWRIYFDTLSAPTVGEAPTKDRNRSYSRPSIPRRSFKSIKGISIVNDAPYIGVINRTHGIVESAQAATTGLLDQLLKRYAPK